MNAHQRDRNLAAVLPTMLAFMFALEHARADDGASKPKPEGTRQKDHASDFALLFGQRGDEVVQALATGATDSAAATAKCAAQVDQTAQEFLAAWAGPPAAKDDPKKVGTRAPKSGKPPAKSAIPKGAKERLGELAQDTATWQLCSMIDSAAQSERSAIAAEFLAHPEFARCLALLVEPDKEDLAKVTRVARMLMDQRAAGVDQLPELAAAISVVHDSPVLMQVNENVATGCEPLAAFDHFGRNERRMFFGIRGIAPELLVYLVDVAASPDELAWSLAQFGGHPAVGSLYDKIEYDYDHLEKGGPKKVTAAGWNLRNILQYGGICADQAYFACTVGKAIGVPCVYTSATDGVLSHAWIGFVARAGRRPQWAEVGRFGTYESVEGMIKDPQTNRMVSNTQMPMLVDYGIEPHSDRLSAAALRIAARRQLGDPKGKAPVTAEAAQRALDLTRVAVQACITDPRSWEMVGRTAASGAMTTAQKEQWAADVLTLCGASYPEYALRTIAPMVDSITDPEARHKAIDAAFQEFSGRGDLAGQLLLQQAAQYEGEGNMQGAGRCYEMILDRYPNDGPFAIVALQKASAILGNMNDVAAAVTLHDRAFRAMEVPKGISPQFAQQSNWFRAGVMLARVLRAAGRERDALLLEQRMANEMR